MSSSPAPQPCSPAQNPFLLGVGAQTLLSPTQPNTSPWGFLLSLLSWCLSPKPNCAVGAEPATSPPTGPLLPECPDPRRTCVIEGCGDPPKGGVSLAPGCSLPWGVPWLCSCAGGRLGAAAPL